MRTFAGSILRGASVFAAVFDHHVTDVHVTYHVAVYRYVLANHKSENLLHLLQKINH